MKDYRRSIVFLLSLALGALPRGAGADTATAARAALEKATTYMRSTAVSGGYPSWASLDFTQRYGTIHQLEATQVWVGDTATTTVGKAFLEAYAATQDARYLDAAQETADGLAWGQLESGGWQTIVDFSPQGSMRYYRRLDAGTLTPEEIAARSNDTVLTYDTQEVLRFMMSVISASGNDNSARMTRIRAALDYGLAGLMQAQYPPGAWPRVYSRKPRNDADYPILPAQVRADWPRTFPADDNYRDFYTINDDVQIDCIDVLLDAEEKLGRADCGAAARKGGDFLILAQLPEPHPGWAQQYNYAMEPAWARKFEPPSAVSRETANVIRELTRLHHVTGDSKYLAPVAPAAAWLRRSQISPGTWAFFYELQTNTPLYFTPTYEMTYSDADIITHYTLFGDMGIPGNLAYYERARREGASFFQSPPAPRQTETETGALGAIAALDSLGRWVSNGRLDSKTFATNVHFLCRYLVSQ